MFYDHRFFAKNILFTKSRSALHTTGEPGKRSNFYFRLAVPIEEIFDDENNMPAIISALKLYSVALIFFSILLSGINQIAATNA